MVLDSRLEDLRGYMFLKCGWMRLDTVGCFRFIEMLSGALGCLLAVPKHDLIQMAATISKSNPILSLFAIQNSVGRTYLQSTQPQCGSNNQRYQRNEHTHTHTIFLVNLCRTSYILYWGCDLELHVNVEVAQDYWPQT